MKIKVSLIILLLIILPISEVYAKSGSANNSVTLGLAYSTGFNIVYNLEYTYAKEKNASITYRLNYPLGAGASFRFYLNSTVLNGPYWGAGVNLFIFKSTPIYKSSGSFYSPYGSPSNDIVYNYIIDPKIELGYNYIFNGGFVTGIEGYVGYIINMGSYFNAAGGMSNSFDAGLGVKIGYGW